MQEGKMGSLYCSFVSSFNGSVVQTHPRHKQQQSCSPSRRHYSYRNAKRPSTTRPTHHENRTPTMQSVKPPNNPSDSEGTFVARSRAGAAREAEADIEDNASSLGETPLPTETQPAYNSTLLTAMRDYFGDDGREVQEYLRRPRDSKTNQPLFRIILADMDAALARKLYESSLCVAIYYLCSPQLNRIKRVVVHKEKDWEEEMEEEPERFVRFNALPDDEMDKWAQLASGTDEDSDAITINDVVSFAKWSLADAVFITEQSQIDVHEMEKQLAPHGITVFDRDVGRAIINGEIDVKECLSSLTTQQDESSVGESLLE